MNNVVMNNYASPRRLATRTTNKTFGDGPAMREIKGLLASRRPDAQTPVIDRRL
jgi:hypothetical protein